MSRSFLWTSLAACALLIACDRDAPDDEGNDGADDQETDLGESDDTEPDEEETDEEEEDTDVIDPSFVPDGEERVALLPNTGCWLDADRALVCWGRYAAELSISTATGITAIARNPFEGPPKLCVAEPEAVACYGLDGTPLAGATHLGTAVSHACAVVDGDLTCWGCTFPDTCTLPSDGDYTELSGAFGSACALDGGAVVCAYGGPISFRSYPPPTGNDFVDLEQAVDLGCALRSNGQTACWGLVDDRQADDGIPGGLVKISIGNTHGCGLRADGRIACWGVDEAGFGVLRPPSGQFDEVRVGGTFACARLGDDLTCWGDDTYAQSTGP